MSFDAVNFTNTNSTISAFGDLVINADNFLNQGADLNRSIYTKLNYQNQTVIRESGFAGWMEFASSRVLSTSKIGDIPAIIAAGGTFTGTATNFFANVSAPIETISQGEFGGTSATIIRQVDLSNPDANLIFPTPSIFVVTPNNPNFVTETRFDFTDFGMFYGSDYFLNGVLGNYNPQDIPRRLGDAFYDTRVIQQQLIDLTGLRFSGE